MRRLAAEKNQISNICMVLRLMRVDMPELDTTGKNNFPNRRRYQQHLREEMWKRFRLEYLDQFIQ
jgi:hypothetical protein